MTSPVKDSLRRWSRSVKRGPPRGAGSSEVEEDEHHGGRHDDDKRRRNREHHEGEYIDKWRSLIPHQYRTDEHPDHRDRGDDDTQRDAQDLGRAGDHRLEIGLEE